MPLWAYSWDNHIWTPTYMMDRGSGFIQQSFTDEEDFIGWSNHRIVPELNDDYSNGLEEYKDGFH